MEAATAIATTVESTTASTAMETASSSTSVTAMLGESGHGRANENEGSDTCERSLQQGGFPLPLGPKIATCSPALIEKVIFRSAIVPSRSTETFSNSNSLGIRLC